MKRSYLLFAVAFFVFVFGGAGIGFAKNRPLFPHEVVIAGGMLVGPTGVVGFDGKSDINHRATLTILAKRDDCETAVSEIFLEAVGSDGAVRGAQKVILYGCRSRKFDLMDLFGVGGDGNAVADYSIIRSRSVWPHAMYAYLRPELEWPTPASFYKFGVPVGRNRHRAPGFDADPGRYQVFAGVETGDMVNGPPPYQTSRILFPVELVNAGSKYAKGTITYLSYAGGSTGVATFELPPGGSIQIATPLGFSGDIAVSSDRDIVARGYLFEYQRDCYVCTPPSVVTLMPIQ